MINFLNLHSLLCKSTFFKCTKNLFVKKRKSGQKVLQGESNRHLWFKKDTFIDLYSTGFQLHLGIEFFFRTENVLTFRRKAFVKFTDNLELACWASIIPSTFICIHHSWPRYSVIYRQNSNYSVYVLWSILSMFYACIFHSKVFFRQNVTREKRRHLWRKALSNKKIRA